MLRSRQVKLLRIASRRAGTRLHPGKFRHEGNRSCNLAPQQPANPWSVTLALDTGVAPQESHRRRRFHQNPRHRRHSAYAPVALLGCRCYFAARSDLRHDRGVLMESVSARRRVAKLARVTAVRSAPHFDHALSRPTHWLKFHSPH